MGGEKYCTNNNAYVWLGSPPRGRGKDESGINCRTIKRITPAWAGKSLLWSPSSSLPRDHPRVGGEKYVFHSDTHGLTGSPPRGRGKGRSISSIATELRITPAWAGKSYCRHNIVAMLRDHPRVGGEKLAFPAILARELGSPPRGRGKAQRRLACCTAARITPAWAGKSSCVKPTVPIAQDHPRVGGEKLGRWAGLIFRQGSPPRGRGKGVVFDDFAGLGGITPAWAGKSGNK